ncbi:hypothetical protein L1049_024057 [Liquidambar formosana]|uniref:Heavy metal-associated isoprenylated plant protein 16-like n=1 Tax=Liquidambar formosana TaxID=63359 RepID=A0AAP0RUN7_LIQFO
MKQKVVIKVTMNGDKSRSKALKIAVGVSGVISAALQGQDKDQIEVTGDGVDAVVLTRLLRKSVGFAELVSVNPVDEKKDSTEKTPEAIVQNMVWPSYVSPYQVYQVPNYSYAEPSCSIM